MDVHRAVHSALTDHSHPLEEAAGRDCLCWRSSEPVRRPWCPKASWRTRRVCGHQRDSEGSFLVLRDHVTHQPRLLCVSSSDQRAPVTQRDVICSGKVFQLSGSCLSFSNLAQLIVFYSFTRDVLPVCLRLPQWIYNIEEHTDYPSQLNHKLWLNTSSEHQSEDKSCMMCSIQLTSSNGALCVINPLYVHEHGDEWMTQHKPRVQSSIVSSKRDNRRLSTTRAWSGAGLHNKRAVSLDQEKVAPISEDAGLVRVRSADSSKNPLPPVSSPLAATKLPSGVVLRRPSKDSPLSPLCTTVTPLSSALASSDDHHSSPMPQSPHRVSWIEDGVWLPPPRPPSQLLPPSLELDSLSVSSIEEEPDPLTPTSSPQTSSTHRLADKVKHRLSAVGQALGGLVCQKKRMNYRVQEMSERKGGMFADSVKFFVESFLQKSPEKDGLTEFLQEVRSSLTTLRESLLDQTEMQVLVDSMMDISDAEIDVFVEQSIHKVALKPLSSHLYGCIQTSRSSDGTLDRLQSNQPRLESSSMEQLGGSAGVGVPDSATLERIRQKWEIMHEAYSPNKKVQILLKVCKSIYHSMSANSNTGAVFGADDFLPCLTWVLLRSDVITLQVDTDYMMELLDPTQLQGEGGYYLTTLYASLFYISSYKPRIAARQLSVEAQKSLNQWHRRRTLHCDQPRRSKHRQTIRRQSYRDRAEAKCDNRDSNSTTSESCDGGTEAETLKYMKEETERVNGVSDEAEQDNSVTPEPEEPEPEDNIDASDNVQS
ncbi:hypothetical protein WMY93_028961 [Mugilogobius chulae]|uniref:VPS9 domain-containing protein n=1 Tax=Mugilogobius chulae TaxID=88201 RepID=A0AAW0MPU8_9GOBI